LRSIYLRQLLELDITLETLTREQRESLAQDVQRDDPAENLMDQHKARTNADKATQRRFADQRELDLAHVDVAIAMGRNPRLPLSVIGTLDNVSLTLPRLEQIIQDSEQESEQIIVALAELNESRAYHCLQQNIVGERRMGPRYQDRLGRDDDTIGVRLDVDLDVHRIQSGPIAESAKATHQQRDEVALARHVWLGEVTRVYRELASRIAELEHSQDDDFIAEQRAILDDEETAALMTAVQRNEIEQSIVAHQMELLQRRYTVAVLRTQIRLDPGVR
jgi:hypothetical protein